AMGGGGGAGTRNNSDGDTQASGGAAGGGIIIIRTYALSGTATLSANGAAAYIGTANDAGGGGGAGGSIVVLSANGGEGGLTLQANGGRGGDAWDSQAYSLGNRHGPGGGGGGGVIIVSGAPASISVTGATSGTTLNPGVTYGATAGAAGTSVTNATISQTSGTQSGAQCTPDMTLGKSHVGNFTRGSTASYTVPVSNLSPYGSTSGAVLVNDTLPLGLIPTSASGTGWACSVASQTVSCVNSTVLAGSSSYASITINANVAQTAPSTVTNTALVSGGGEVNLANDSATDVANVVSSADLSVTNTAAPNPVTAGNNITYTQVVTNNGPSAADNATVVQAVPANTTFVSVSAPSGWSCITPVSGGTGNVVCSNVKLGSSVATFSLLVKVTAGTANGTVITDSVTASSSTSDPNSANNSASASTVVGTTAGAELTVTNVASPNPVLAGNNITYTQVVTNTGTAAATTATFNETTPTNTTLVSITPPAGWSCAAFPPQCTNASVAAGSSGTFIAIYKVGGATPSGTIISDTAAVNAANQAFGANSALATDVVATAGQADLVLTTAATPPSVIAGNNITYTQTITNNGPSTATALSFSEAIPANTTFVSVSAPAGWSCTATTSVTCTTASLAASASADIIVAVHIAPSVAAGTITETASVSATTTDPNPANNTNITVNTPVVDKCDQTVTNSGNPNPVSAGGTITYTQTVTNHGPSNGSNANFSEATPANTTFVSVSAVTTGGGTWTCPNVAPIACTNPSVPPGSLATITAVYTVNAGTPSGTIITDIATASSSTQDTNWSDNTATVSIAVASAGQADLSVTNAGTPNPVNAGQNITYSQTVTNGGPATASTVTLTETLPANTTFVSLSGAAGWACTSTAPYTCSIASLAANTPASFSFVVKVNTTVASGSTITDTASVASSVTTDPNSGNNSASASVQVADSSDLSLTNSASPIPVIAGNTITYTQVVTNAGSSAATSATFTETTPPNTTFVQLTPVPGGWSCILPPAGAAGTVTCTNPSFAIGTASFPVVVKVTAGTPAGTAINDTASVNSSTTDPNPANNAATAADVVALATQADLITTNSALPASVAAGSNVTYTQSVTNNGPAAAAAGATFTQVTPPNTTFQSITPPAGWTCGTVPAVGGTGTITCTASGTLAVNSLATFTLVLQVNANTPSGTNIAETSTATATNIVPNLTSNSATALVVVANANSADMSIVKTASPSPTVPEGDTLTYTLSITNNGPAQATNVTVTDTLPSAVTYQSSISSAGTCSEADGTVTCLLGTMANAGTATVTIVTMAGTPGVAINTANVTADQTDPNLANNSSSQTETITAATKIQLHAFGARAVQDKTGASRVALLWKTGAEARNLGFNVYREQNGERVRLNPSLIAGSALLMSGALPKHSGKTYAWIDSSSGAGAGAYWVEDIDVNGTRSMHGPVTADSNISSPSSADPIPSTALMFNQLNQAQPAAAFEQGSHSVEMVLRNFEATPNRRQMQFELAAHPAVKILVKHEGWHRVTQPELIKAGLDPNVDPALLHLYAEAVEQPIKITGALPGPGGFGPQAALEFYGTGIDTPYSGTRVYWLVAGEGPGQRIHHLPSSAGSNQPRSSFQATVELTPRTTYFAALITSDGNNFFGSLVSSTPVDQTITTPNFDKCSTNPASLEVVLQGVILGIPHDVAIAVNGTTLGNLTFAGQDKGTFRMNLPPGVLQDGNNTVTLTAQDGDYDTSLVQSIRIDYPHSYVADSDGLKFTGRAGDELKVTGFTAAPIVVLDITNPDQPVELTPRIVSNVAPNSVSNSTQYELQVQVPWMTTNSVTVDRHTLLALAADRIDAVAGIRPNHPSHWHRPQSGSEIVMVSPGAFANSLVPLLRAHEAKGQSTAVVLIDDLYDEFNFGERTPAAIRDFLYTATKVWRTTPRYLLLNGRASVDPRNYLGFGHLDFVPTRIVPATGLMTASDDWFSDFNNSGMPTIATGRLPVSTADEANLVARKVSAYEGQSTNGAWTSQALMVADVNDTENFTQDSETLQAQLPSTLNATDVFVSTTGPAAAQQAIIAAINSGQLLVNYAGHGSEEQWSGDDLFNNTVATSLTNSSSLPVFLIMDCLNGLFQDVYEQPLAVTLMLAPNGGAVAVLASSGLNQPAPQTILDKLIVQNALHSPYPALGDAIVKAKSGITDLSVRQTFNLLGDPAMQIKPPQQNPVK
ncbi:MAG: C25 family cysteine peptidase, partial [Candidatus Sulfotelmatobacter sp.]